MKVDIVVGISYGDEAKGKVTHHLLKHNKYTHCISTSGGDNKGHTIYHNGEKVVTHLIPAGVFFNIPSLIGPGCVLNVKSFFQEIQTLESKGIKANSLVKIADNTHIVTEKHLAEDAFENKIGTTRRGIGPAYRDKYARIGIQAKQIPELKDYLIDFHQEIFSHPDNYLIAEGAQGFYLDPHFGDYPYVTSSHGTVAGVLLNGIPHTAIRNVIGVGKAYDTYVGSKEFQPEGEIYNQLREIGLEFGATTGRARQCNFLNVTALKKAAQVNAITKLIVNKMDVLQKLNTWKVIENNQVVDLKSEEKFKDYLLDRFENVTFSYSPESI